MSFTLLVTLAPQRGPTSAMSARSSGGIGGSLVLAMGSTLSRLVAREGFV
jgi:hypothetical protein